MICLNRSVLDFMAARLTPASFVIEFGAGGSTRWFADRCGRLVSVETSRTWTERVRKECAWSACDWDVRARLGEVSDADLVLVDSVWRNRDADARAGWAALKRGGWLLFDDAQRERHAVTIAWLTACAGEPVALSWAEGDIETATERLTLAWAKV